MDTLSDDIKDDIRDAAMVIAPDYPGIETASPCEQLWAMKQSYEGLVLANKGLHKILQKLTESSGIAYADWLSIALEKETEKTGD